MGVYFTCFNSNKSKTYSKLKAQMDDLSNLNNELSSITQDFARHQELQQIKQNLYNDPTQAKINNRMSELTQFQGRFVREDSGPNPYPHQPVQPRQNAVINNPQPQNSRVDVRQQNYQQAMQSYPQHPATYDDNVDPRQDMNSRLDRFRFESVNPIGSLVPVNMDHIYSGNLFAEGLPVPSDLRNQFTLSSPGMAHGGASRILHQEKSKTGYRNDVNDRLSKLSPLGRSLYYPISGQPTSQPSGNPQQQQPPPPQWGAGMAQAGQFAPPQYHGQQQNPMQQAQVTSRRGALTDDINRRMSNHPALGAAMPLDENMVNYSRTTLATDAPNMTPNLDPNRQVKKVVFQDMYPVMSNY
jgi:hypothetical protein